MATVKQKIAVASYIGEMCDKLADLHERLGPIAKIDDYEDRCRAMLESEGFLGMGTLIRFAAMVGSLKSVGLCLTVRDLSESN